MVDKANTGRGLQAADLYDMLNQSSPLAYGATLSQGRYKDRDGNLQSAFSVISPVLAGLRSDGTTNVAVL
jgi:hypothetical protein